MHDLIRYGEVMEWRYSVEHELLTKPFWTSLFLVDGLLIDSGAPGAQEEFREFITFLDDKERVDKCILTHWHEDHSGGAKILTEEFNIPVYTHEKNLEKIRNGFEYEDFRQMTWGYPFSPAPKVQPLPPPPILTRSGKYEFEIFSMPGHDAGLIALIERSQGWAFVADAVLPKFLRIFRKTNIKESIEEIYNSMKALLTHVKDLEKLNIFIAGHGLFEDGRKLITEKINELDEMHEKVHALKAQGYSDRKILRTTLGKEGMIGNFTRGVLSKMNLVKSLLEWDLD